MVSHPVSALSRLLSHFTAEVMVSWKRDSNNYNLLHASTSLC